MRKFTSEGERSCQWPDHQFATYAVRPNTTIAKIPWTMRRGRVKLKAIVKIEEGVVELKL